MKIVVDAMGGDHAPEVVIKGTSDALRDFADIEVILVGNIEKITPFLKKDGLLKHPRVRLVHSEQVVEMKEPSTVAIRAKKNSSITIGASLIQKGEADALVSAGHTGAAVAAGKVKIRMLPGVERPAIATIMPSPKGPFILIDAGANTDCKPIHLAQFAIMGEVFAKLAFHVATPKIGLLSVGEEDVKGNDLTKETFKILSKMPINFAGNIEGNIIFEKPVDVIVCDGFVGNVLLKASESVATAIMCWIKEAFTKNPFRKAGALLAKNAFYELKKISDHEEYGGAPLLGLNGICIIGHGNSSEKAIKNAIRAARESIKFEINHHITSRIIESGIAIKK